MGVVEIAIEATVQNPNWIQTFWPFLFGELPRYAIFSLIALILHWRKTLVTTLRPQLKENAPLPKWTALIVGHNEGEHIRQTIQMLHEQMVPPSEIVVVSDGSTDHSKLEIQALIKEKLIDSAHHVDARNGKAAAANLGIEHCHCEIMGLVDGDTILSRDLSKKMLRYFQDPNVGAVTSNLAPRGAPTTLMQWVQHVEYAISISIGKLVLDQLDMISCISGACGFFRMSVLKETHGYNAGSGEDFDLTLRIRRFGWAVKFAPDAFALTQAPKTLGAYYRQRLRWDGDTAGIRFRRQWYGLILGKDNTGNREIWHNLDYIYLYTIPLLIMPFYLAWLISQGALYAFAVIGILYLMFMIQDFILILIGSVVRGCVARPFITLLGVPLYSTFALLIYRPIRLWAVLSELVFHRSQHDNFVPEHVRKSLYDFSK